jgi:hypothetical protein
VGVQGSDAVTLNTAGATGTFDTKNVGTGKTVTVAGLTISGTTVTAGDYTLTQPTTTANITSSPIVWNKPADISFGTPLTNAVQLNATEVEAGSFVYSPPPGTILNAGANQTLTVVFTPTDTIDFPILTDTVTINVNPAATTTTINAPPALTSGMDGKVSVTVGLGSGVPATAGTPTGTVSLTVDGGTPHTAGLTNGVATFDVGVLGVGNHSLSASYAAQGNYAASSTPANTTLVVNPPISVTTTSLPAATVKQTYSQTLQSTGGTGAITYSVLSGSLPADLNLSASGAITGSPRTAGSYSISVEATDSLGATATGIVTLLVNPASWTINKSGYNQVISEPGSDTFAVTAGSLPKGLSISSTTGAITGTPTKAGTFNFTLTLTDTTSGATSTQSYSITINPALAITSSLPNWTVNGPNYNAAVTTTGGTGAVTFALKTGNKLPAGLSLNAATGAITGTPTRAGTYAFTLIATDSVFATASKAYTLIINPPVTITTKSPLPNGKVNSAIPYKQTIAVKGGTTTKTAKYNFSVPANTLPPGLNLDPKTGILSGTPTQAGSFTFTITVTDQGGGSATQTYTVTITS